MTVAVPTRDAGTAASVAAVALRVLVAAALAVDAVVHLRLAADYQLAAPGGIGQGNLFRIEAAVAVAVGLYVLLTGSRTAYTAAFLVTASALTAVLVYRYIDVPSIGPIPSMYEPLWFFQKSLSAVAEGAGALLAAGGVALTTFAAPRSPHRVGKPRPAGGVT
ncbi:MAG: hypothetical protein QOK15_2331 [Nocardioidaceae bacterium]|jgi:hypothetical protein|nr:hypothetical protein [Nocardioidaceae bacterium]